MAYKFENLPAHDKERLRHEIVGIFANWGISEKELRGHTDVELDMRTCEQLARKYHLEDPLEIEDALRSFFAGTPQPASRLKVLAMIVGRIASELQDD